MSATQATVTSMQVAVRYRQNVGSLSTCRPTLGQHIDQEVLVNIVTDISVGMSTHTSQSTHLPRVGRYVDQHIGRSSIDMSTDIIISQGVRKLHMILFFFFLHNKFTYQQLCLSVFETCICSFSLKPFPGWHDLLSSSSWVFVV